MTISPAAGKPADPSILVNVPKLITAYYELRPDPSDPRQRVVFGTSGHRGSAFDAAFNEWHILAIAQAICDYRKLQKIDGPLYLGIDTHALSEPAYASALEVLAANGTNVMPVSYTHLDVYKRQECGAGSDASHRVRRRDRRRFWSGRS